MPKIQSSEILTQLNKRYFLQPGGAGPVNGRLYGGQDGQYMVIESTTNNSGRGETSDINVPDPSAYKRFRQVGQEVSVPDRPSATVSFLQPKDAMPRALYDLSDCVATFYELSGACVDPSDFLNGWTAMVKIWSNGTAGNREEGGGTFDGDSQVADDLDYTFEGVYTVGTLIVGEKAATEVYSEVVDVVYGSRAQCGECGPADSGTKLIYGVTNNVVSSPGEPPDVVFSTAGGVGTWTVQDITGSVSTDVPVAIDIVGQYLVVLFRDATTGGFFVSEIDRLTGIPGTWVKVTTGFSTGNLPSDMYVANPREIYIACDNGFVLKSTSILEGVSVLESGDQTAQNLNRIDGFANTVVAAGESQAVIYSTDRGDTWVTADNTPGSGGIDALWVIDDNLWWAGDDAGVIYYTTVQGKTAWVTKALPAATVGTLATIQDINFATDEVGYIVAATAGPAAALFVTYDGGRTWATSTTKRLPVTFPTMDRVNRISFPAVPNMAVAANNLVLGGLAGDGADGIILVASPVVK